MDDALARAEAALRCAHEDATNGEAMRLVCDVKASLGDALGLQLRANVEKLDSIPFERHRRLDRPQQHPTLLECFWPNAEAKACGVNVAHVSGAGANLP